MKDSADVMRASLAPADGPAALPPINWAAPWLDRLNSLGMQLARQTDWLAAINRYATERSLVNHRGLPVTFIRQETAPANLAYEACISHSGQVPTRNNLHDFFNAVMWLHYPATKRVLNAVQASEIERDGIRSSRGPVRDAATLFDENGVLMVVRDNQAGNAMIHALHDHDWSNLLLRNRERFHIDVDVVMFGHALLEKLTHPYKAITAHVWCVQADENYFVLAPTQRIQWLDQMVAAQWQTDKTLLHPTRFGRLPVLGIPGWCPEQDAAFYNDASVFRRKRSHR